KPLDQSQPQVEPYGLRARDGLLRSPKAAGWRSAGARPRWGSPRALRLAGCAGRLARGLLRRGLSAFGVVALAGPGGKDQDDLSALLALDAMPLARLEREQRSRAGDHDVGAGFDARFPFDDRQPGAFAHLVVAQLLTGREAYDDRARSVDGLEDGRRAGSVRRLDLGHVPGLHPAIVFQTVGVRGGTRGQVPLPTASPAGPRDGGPRPVGLLAVPTSGMASF